MAALLGAVLAIAVAVVVLVVVVVLGQRRLAANQESWTLVAADLGLLWKEVPEDPGVGRVSGTLEGFEVSIFRERLQSATHPSRRWPVTRVRTELGADLGVGMAVATRNAGGGWAMKAALQPKVRVEDPLFEMKVLAHARDPQAAARWLGPEARAALLGAAEQGLGFYLDDTGIVSEFEGVLRDRARLVATARGQVALAEALKEAWKDGAAQAPSTR